MLKIVRVLFPVFDWIYIFQLLGYDRNAFIGWISRYWTRRNVQKKQSLTPTPKALVIFFLSCIIFLLTFSLISLFAETSAASCQIKILLLGIFFMMRLQFYFIDIWLASLLIAPFDSFAKQAYIKQAKQKISSRKNLVVIGITGSYGKTSTRRIIVELLRLKFNVLETDENYNTLMGVSKVILENLRPEHEIFVVEMGAYQRGDIRDLCDLVMPKIGILTGIAEQHLERFGSLEAIIKTKSELIDSLPPHGLLLLNGDNEYIRNINIPEKLRKVSYSVEKPSDWKASVTKTDKSGSVFTLSPGGEVKTLQLALLGKHNVLNSLPALFLAREFGIAWERIADKLLSLIPPPHRLELIQSNPNLIIIDDAYSSNVEGFKAALEVLGTFSNPGKILITPGIVELGTAEKRINEMLGALAAKMCSVVVLIGNSPRTKAFRKGLLFAGFKENYILQYKDLREAQAHISEFTASGDVLLFENDLPDQY